MMLLSTSMYDSKRLQTEENFTVNAVKPISCIRSANMFLTNIYVHFHHALCKKIWQLTVWKFLSTMYELKAANLHVLWKVYKIFLWLRGGGGGEGVLIPCSPEISDRAHEYDLEYIHNV